MLIENLTALLAPRTRMRKRGHHRRRTTRRRFMRRVKRIINSLVKEQRRQRTSDNHRYPHTSGANSTERSNRSNRGPNKAAGHKMIQQTRIIDIISQQEDFK